MIDLPEETSRRRTGPPHPQLSFLVGLEAAADERGGVRARSIRDHTGHPPVHRPHRTASPRARTAPPTHHRTGTYCSDLRDTRAPTVGNCDLTPNTIHASGRAPNRWLGARSAVIAIIHRRCDWTGPTKPPMGRRRLRMSLGSGRRNRRARTAEHASTPGPPVRRSSPGCPRGGLGITGPAVDVLVGAGAHRRRSRCRSRRRTPVVARASLEAVSTTWQPR